MSCSPSKKSQTFLLVSVTIFADFIYCEHMKMNKFLIENLVFGHFVAGYIKGKYYKSKCDHL